MKKMKFFAILVLALWVSAATSYVTTLSLSSIYTQNLQQSSQQSQSQNTTKTKINLSFSQVEFDINGASTLEVAMSETVDDLTIVYQYTYLNGTTLTESIDYGNYTPSWSGGDVISPRDVPHLQFRIPDVIVHAASSVKGVYQNGNLVGRTWDVFPQVEVLEVYGYAQR